MSLPPKVKSFLWRACMGILPTYELLWRRHMRNDGLCHCGASEVESVSHSLWSCSLANDVWLESGLNLQKWDRSIPHFFDLMEAVRRRLSPEDIGLFSCLAYFIWGQRNKVVHEKLVGNPIVVVKQAKNLLKGYKESVPAVASIDSGTMRSHVLVGPRGRWVPPPAGCCKVNWDIARDSAQKLCYVGVVVRDYDSKVLAARCSPIQALPLGVHPYIGACIKVLKFSVEMGFLDIYLEGPPVKFMQQLHVQHLGSSIEDMWLEEIQFYVQQLRSFTLQSAVNGSNFAATALAQVGLSSKLTKVWVEDSPLELLGVL
uniref:Reverse transcriptase zinc-binding domain-containing protein n=1 Tax=Fagus sylvatica TaxID=28930 RepID=A0A2N9F9E6_FAGSY